MNDDLNLLITVYYEEGQTLLKCAVKVEHGMNRFDYDDMINYQESENAALLNKLLPEHVRSCGPIVEVERIFEICDAPKESTE